MACGATPRWNAADDVFGRDRWSRANVKWEKSAIYTSGMGGETMASPKPSRYDVFLSYSSEDADKVATVQKYIERYRPPKAGR